MTSDDIRIVVLQRGWVCVGRYSKDGDQCFLDGAHVIRRWGTSKGLGQLAVEGPQSATVLDKVPRVQFHQLTAIMAISCEAAPWSTLCR